jgi:broad specificity phosphatase PhoE
MRPRMATLLMIRHGQASYGQADYDRLTPKGEHQAQALGKYLADLRIDRLFVGPHRRHAETLDGAARAAGNLPPATMIDELAEYPAFGLLQHFMPTLVASDPKFAQLTQTPTRQLANEAFHTILNRWARDEWDVTGVERVTEFAARVRSGLDRIVREATSGARLAIVTSAGPIGVAVGLVFGASEHHMIRASTVIRNTSISELRFRSQDFDWHPERVGLIAFNSIHHLPPELHTEY